MAHPLIIGDSLNLFGPVGFRGAEDDGFTVRDVTEALAEMTGNITVRINSGGGSAFDGIAIHNALVAHDGEVTTVVQGIAASAASVIFMAGSERIMAHSAMLMIHDATGMTIGTEADQLKQAKTLGKLSNNLASIYAGRTGRDVRVMRTAMRAETWFDGAEAVEAGLATSEINMGAAEASAFNYAMYMNAPDFLVKRAGNMGEQFDRAVAMALFAAPRQLPKEADMPGILTPPKATTRDSWKAEFERSPTLQAEFLNAEGYAAYMAADAKGLIKVCAATPPAITPSKATTPDGWRAEYEASEDLRAEFVRSEDYVAYMNADAAGLIRTLRSSPFHRGAGRGV